jgi:hypothetical protein
MPRNGSPKQLQFYKVEGPVSRDTATYFLTATDLSLADFKNVRRNAAAVITCAISDMMDDSFEETFGCAGGEYASRVRAQNEDVQIDPRIFGRCVEILEEGCDWVNGRMKELRAAGGVETEMVKLALLARVIAARHANLWCEEEMRQALARLMVGSELGPLTVNDAAVPLSAPEWLDLEVAGARCKYTRTWMGDYGSPKENMTVWVDGVGDKMIVAVARALGFDLSTVGVHRDTRYSTTHFNVYPNMADAQHRVCRNMATEVVTNERRYNTSCPIIFGTDAEGNIRAIVDDEVAAMYFFRACDVLPRKLAELFTNRVESGAAPAQGYTLIGAFRHWANITKGTKYAADPQYCARLGRELINAALGPYDEDEIRDFMKARRIFLLKESFLRYDYQVAKPGVRKTQPMPDVYTVPSLDSTSTMEVPSSLVDARVASTLESAVAVVDLTAEVERMAEESGGGRVVVTQVSAVVVTMDNALLMAACGAVGCASCRRTFIHTRRDQYAVAIASAMLHSVVEFVTCPVCRKACPLQDAVRFAYSQPE